MDADKVPVKVETSTRGHKGQKSRSGYSKKVGFEGGQMPLQRRLPKFGFNNPNRKEYKAINLSTLDKLAEKNSVENIDFNVMREAGLVQKNDLVKILGVGKLNKKINVKAHGFSKTAAEAIEAIGGKAEKL